VTRILAIYPAVVAALLVVLAVLAPRSGILALATIFSSHLTLVALALVPIALVRRGTALRWSLAVLALVALLRFGGEWISLPPTVDGRDALLRAASWNLEIGARDGESATRTISELDVDVVALQELGPDHVRAIAHSSALSNLYPGRALYPDAGVYGMGLLSRWPILRVENHLEPALIEAVIDVGGRPVTIITAHPLAGRLSMVGPFPVALDSAKRDLALRGIRARVDAAIARGESVIVLGDFNVTPNEPAHRELVDGLRDAHAEAGQGPGWTWRPSSLEWAGLGVIRIDHVFSSPDLAPVSIAEDCSRVGDHCIVEASFADTSPRVADRRFEETFPAQGDIKALPIVVTDRTGLIRSIELQPGNAPEDGISVMPARPSSLVVSWLGGMCDERVDVAFGTFGPSARVAVSTKRAGGCLLAGIGRSVILNLDRPIDPRIVEFEEVP
jgi:endonuclease/exonuclease/phosphatase (EEP) superfamily protein YafD